MSNTKIIRSISRAADILKILAEGKSKLKDIQSGLHKSTTHRILKSLVSCGLAFQSPVNHNYYLGPLFLRLAANPTVSHRILLQSSLDELCRLRDFSNETAAIITPNGDKRVVLRELPSKQEIRFTLGEGNSASIFVGISGRVLLSQYEVNELSRMITTTNTTEDPSETAIDTDTLTKDIDKIHKEGFFATRSGPVLSDSSGISMPVKGYVCPVALCVFGPSFRFEPMSVLEQLTESARLISERLKAMMEIAG